MVFWKRVCKRAMTPEEPRIALLELKLAIVERTLENRESDNRLIVFLTVMFMLASLLLPSLGVAYEPSYEYRLLQAFLVAAVFAGARGWLRDRRECKRDAEHAERIRLLNHE